MMSCFAVPTKIIEKITCTRGPCRGTPCPFDQAGCMEEVSYIDNPFASAFVIRCWASQQVRKPQILLLLVFLPHPPC